MRVALDASYSVDAQPSGIAVYSQQLLIGLAASHPQDRFLHYYRPKQFRRSLPSSSSNVTRRLLLPFPPTFRASVFHALNQRLDRRFAPKTVTTFHDLFVFSGDYSTPSFKERFVRQARQAAANSDLIIAVSAFTARQVHEFLNVPKAQIRVIPHGVSPRPVQASDYSREKLVLFVGALQIRKNVARLIDAFASLPDPWRLVLAGSPTGYRADEILAAVERSSVRSRIDVPGYLSRAELDSLFARSSIFAFPSLDEGFGIPVLEAMNFGVPVLTSNGSALSETAGNAALLVDPLDTAQIASGLQRLAADDELRNQLISAGHHRASDFTWDRAVELTFETYRELTR